MTGSTIPATMREYRFPKFTGFGDLTLQDASVPTPGANEVLVKIHAASLNFRDLAVAKGRYALGLKSDLVPLSDMAGEVISVGVDVHKFAPGVRVTANFFPDHVFGETSKAKRDKALGGSVDGVLREYAVFAEHSLVEIPEHLSYEEAATLPCAAVTAYSALLGPVPIKGGDTVLVLGTGGVSIFALQIAVASGATVIATSSSDEKLQIAKKLGAKHLINYNTTPEWDEEVLNITKGEGVDHVIEIGGAGTMLRSVNAARYAGWIHDIGLVAPVEPGTNPSALPLAVLRKSVCLRGISVGSRTQFEALNRLISASGLRPVVDRVFAFEDARAAYEYLDSQKHVGKVVIKVSKNNGSRL
ncbi:hypothetical protein CERSUDRAFT_85661 [Gelatoporia subvermispora B]|uniref:Enoyl reductase (ER) domain-containing protein n=1 Tax=Ceriporiopsis subvermispora (strain B) TaxID=914234 RepID=M2PG06_CERS8|nr:hypothetical protein CERSUDRAFT_85661 [Gelatoporia subvermispora B]